MCVTANLWQICDAVCSIMKIVRDSTSPQSGRFAAELTGLPPGGNSTDREQRLEDAEPLPCKS
ncbi:hypothetical protein D3C72_2567810 [compost metagenome]